METSKITRGEIANGSVVQTSSGSRYFLSPEPAVKKANILAAIRDVASAKPGSTITLTQERKQAEAKKALQAVEQAKPRATFSLFGFGGDGDDAAPSPAPAPRKAVAARAAAKKPTPVAKKSTPVPKKTAPASKPAVAPRGVPTFKSWRKNRDGSVTGIISGSPSFSDGDRVTTSPITKGDISKGQVVTTGSGSRYFLS